MHLPFKCITFFESTEYFQELPEANKEIKLVTIETMRNINVVENLFTLLCYIMIH